MKTFKSLLLASVLFTSAVSFASENPAPTVEAASWSTYISDKISAAYSATKTACTTVKDVVVYPVVKANEGCNFVNGKVFTLNAEDKTYAQMFKSNASQIAVVTTAVALAAYATYAYVTKTDKKAKN